MAKILIIEDDKDLAAMVVKWMSSERHDLELCHDGAEANDILRINQYDLLVVDWDLPGLSGIEIVKQFRGNGGTTPIIFLTGRGRIDDKEAAFDSGADDYLTKPFSVKELAVRIRAMLRRPKLVQTSILKNGNIELDKIRHKVSKSGVEVHILPRDFALLEFLMVHCDQVFSAEGLLARVWTSDSDASKEGLRSAIRRIRKKLDDEKTNSIIENIPRVGYRIRSDQQ